MTDWIETGQPAPDFTLETESRESWTLSQHRGKTIALYFYPKDFTPGCTQEACDFRDRSQELAEAGVEVVGISPDNAATHADFRREHRLNFRLLADPDHRVAEAYGAWREKTLYGKKTVGIQRSTVLIDAEGRIDKVWKRVRVDGHAGQDLEAARRLAAVV